MTWRLVTATLMMAAIGLAGAAPAPTQASRTQALARYQHDLVSVLTLRADAPHLLGAALLARTFEDSSPGLDYSGLLQRAARADPDNPAVAWAQLADCDRKAGACPNPGAMERLKTLAPDNAAVWILTLDLAAREGNRKAQLASLAKAAAARVYNDYGGELLKALTLAATALPVPDQALRDYIGASDSQAGPASAQVFLAYGQTAAIAEPSFFPLMALCDPDGDAKEGTRRNQCLALAGVLAWGSSPRARAAGLHLQEVLAGDAGRREAARSDMRDLTWQVRNYSHLVLKALRKQSLAVQLLRLGQSGGSELSRMSALLHHEGIPTRAPADMAAATAGSSAPATPASVPAAPARTPAQAASAVAPASSAPAPPPAGNTPAPAHAQSAPVDSAPSQARRSWGW